MSNKQQESSLLIIVWTACVALLATCVAIVVLIIAPPRVFWAWHNERIESVTITPESRQFFSFLACPEWSSP